MLAVSVGKMWSTRGNIPVVVRIPQLCSSISLTRLDVLVLHGGKQHRYHQSGSMVYTPTVKELFCVYMGVQKPFL